MTMTRWRLWVAGALAFSRVAQAEAIHKCTGPDGIVYQNRPCAAGQQEQNIETMSRNAGARDRDAEARPRQGPRESTLELYQSRRDSSKASRSSQASRYAATPFGATSLFIGMTDTQVLNLPSWGRPTRISRSKGSEGWREQWVYSSSDEMSLLYFQNGRLVDREDAPAPTLQARAAPGD
jgi:hypothetical protein